jgi:hypothetical protein
MQHTIKNKAIQTYNEKVNSRPPSKASDFYTDLKITVGLSVILLIILQSAMYLLHLLATR